MSAIAIPPPLLDTLALVADAAAGARHEWWIIGSAAVALHGGDVGCPKDVDLLMSAPDADGLLRRVGAEVRRGTGEGRFRSEVFGIWTKPSVPVEAFGGFWLLTEGVWRTVQLGTREAICIGDRQVFVPERKELVQLLRSFGRRKDLERAQLLGG